MPYNSKLLSPERLEEIRQQQAVNATTVRIRDELLEHIYAQAHSIEALQAVLTAIQREED